MSMKDRNASLCVFVCVCGGGSQLHRMGETRGRGAHFSNVVIRETMKQSLNGRYVQPVCVCV